MAGPGANEKAEMEARNLILLPSSMNVADFEKQIFKKPTTQTARAKTVEDVLYLFGKHQGVVGTILMNRGGKIVSTTFTPDITGTYCGASKQVLDTIGSIVGNLSLTQNPNQINIIRINSCNQEIIIAPVAGEDLIFIIIQKPTDRASVLEHSKDQNAKAKESEMLDARDRKITISDGLDKLESPLEV